MKKVGVTIISKRYTLHQSYKALWITGSQVAYGLDYSKAMLVLDQAEFLGDKKEIKNLYVINK